MHRINIVGCCLLLALLAALPNASRAGGDVEETLEVLQGRYKEYIADLAELIAIPSVSALPKHENDVRRAAKWLSSRLEKIGMKKTRIMETLGPRPVVYAEWKQEPKAGEKRPCVLIYGHYDVQPIDPIDDWKSPPWKLTNEYGHLIGRGADDDKGGLMMPVHAVEAMLNVTGSLPVDVKFMFEGEEEVMSPHLHRFLKDNKELLQSDLVLSADGMQFSENQGVIPIGLRGIVNFDINVQTAGDDVHSGRLGGSVANANMVLAGLLSKLQDPITGKILVPGFYENVREPDEKDILEARTYRTKLDVGREQVELGLSRGYWGEEGYSNEERRWFRPCCDVVGMHGGFEGEEGIKTIIPHKARAKLSCRLVPGQDSADVGTKVMAYLSSDAKLQSIVEVSMQQGAIEAWQSPRDTLGNRAAAKVLKEVFQYPPKFIREGGSIPAMTIMAEVLKTPITIFGFGLGNKIHAPNEFLPSRMYKTGLKAWAKILWELGHPSGSTWLPGDDGYPNIGQIESGDSRGVIKNPINLGGGGVKKTDAKVEPKSFTTPRKDEL